MNRNNSDPKTITAAEMSINGASRGHGPFLMGNRLVYTTYRGSRSLLYKISKVQY